MAKICRKALVSGRVQGVFFRKYTQIQAITFGVTGYAINLADGRVDVLACGEEQAVNQLFDWLLLGSPNSKVTECVVSEVLPYEDYQEFRIG